MAKGIEERELELDCSAEPRVAHDVRRKFEEFIRPYRVPVDDVEAIKVALSEACSNAVCHGSPDGALNHVRVHLGIQWDRLEILVDDEGHSYRPREIGLPRQEEYKPSGRGLFLMQALMDEVSFESAPRGTRVRMVKQLPAHSGAAECHPEPARQATRAYA